MENLKLYRKRFIPLETVKLKDDEILLYTPDLIVTRWKTLKPRPDFASGISAYYMEKGYKISRIFDTNGQQVHWYCDIMRPLLDSDNGSIVFEDLLIDVIIDNDGTVHVVDTDEAAEAFDENLIDGSTLSAALKSLDRLLEFIENGGLGKVQELMDSLCR